MAPDTRSSGLSVGLGIAAAAALVAVIAWSGQATGPGEGSARGTGGTSEAVASSPPETPSLDRVRDPAPAKVPVYKPDWHPEGVPPADPPDGLFGKDFVRGVAVGLHTELPGLSYKQLFSEVRALGATHVSLVVSWSMPTVRSVVIHPHPVETPPDAEVRKRIQEARAAGLEVLLFPILHIERRRSGEWRGKLDPVSSDRWWAAYEDYILHYADIAAQEKAVIFSVGSELLSLEHDKAAWTALAAKVRTRFDGKLIYSANWDHFDHVTFWDALDLAGMTGYFELSDEEAPQLEELRETWEGAADVIATYRERSGKPVILTEVGYPSQRGAAGHPWDYTRRQAPDPKLQYMCFRAMYEAWTARFKADKAGAQAPLQGFFAWNWYGYGGASDGGYTLRGKPSEAILKRWFKAPPR